jgi:hypothetical protein
VSLGGGKKSEKGEKLCFAINIEFLVFFVSLFCLKIKLLSPHGVPLATQTMFNGLKIVNFIYHSLAPPRHGRKAGNSLLIVSFS